MKKNITKKSILAVSVILIAGFIASQAVAHMNGSMYGNQNGYGNHMMGYGNYMGPNISVEDQAKMHEQMDAFFEATKGIREKIYKKRVALSREYAKDKKDQGAIDTLENDLFDLNTQLEKKRFEHMKAMQDLFPYENGRYGTGMGQGYGMGMGHGYGGCY